MDALIENLPRKTDNNANLYVLYKYVKGLYDEVDGNEITPKQVARIREKGWEVYYWNRDWIKYDANTAINEIENNASLNTSTIYNLNGQHINTLKRGINIVDGKKVMVK